MDNVSNNQNIINGDNYIIDNSIKMNEANTSIDFQPIEIGRKHIKDYEKRINKISFVTIIIGLVTVIVDLVASVLASQNVTSTSVCILIIGVICIIFGLSSYIKYVVLLKKKKITFISTGIWNKLADNEIIRYKLSSKCLLCGGEVNVITATYKSSDGEMVLKKPIGVCSNSNNITKHYYEYDDITKKGRLMNQQEANIYNIK